jgi:hypothetical protein
MNKFFALFIGISCIAQAETHTPLQRAIATYTKDGGTYKRQVQIRETGSLCIAKPADETLRQRLVNLAASQWQGFGFQVWDISSRIPEFFPGGKDFEIMPSHLNPSFSGAQQRMLRIGLQEDEQVTDAYIATYWASTPQGRFFITRQNKLWDIATTAGWADPWSAAFISWVMCEAGLTEEQFKRSSHHSDYLDQIIAQSNRSDAVYKAVNYMDAGVPEPGDIICADRGQETEYDRLADYQTGKFRPLHCDLVVKKDWPHNRVLMIGGNVGNSVTLTAARIIKAGEKFHIERTIYRPWFVVLKLQTGGKAKLEEALLEISNK